MSFVVSDLLECNEQLLDLGKDGLPGFASLSVCLLLTICFLGFTLPFSPVLSFLHPSTSFAVLSVSFPVSLFAILIFPLCFRISLLSPVYHIYLFKSLPNLRLPSPPLLYLTQKLQAVCVDRVNIYSTEFHRRLYLFFLLELVLGSMNNNEPDSSAWFVALVTDITWSQAA